MKDKRTYRRGDIYLVDLGNHYGSEQGGFRPVVVIQNDIGNKYAPTLIVAPITSRTRKKAKQPTHYHPNKMECFSEPSMVLLEQITAIDKSRVKKFIGKFSKVQIKKVDYCIEISLCLRKVEQAVITAGDKL